MDDAPLFALGLALACLAGVRVYLTVFGVGLAALLGWVDLSSGTPVMTSPWVLGTAGLLMLAEFFADKIPGVDSAWDLLHTVVRVPAGAFLAHAAIDPSGDWSTLAVLAGGATALASHGAKSAARAAVNASPEPASNWVASTTEDITVLGSLALVFTHPFWALGLMITLLAGLGLMAWLFWRGARWLVRALRGTRPEHCQTS